MNSYQNRIIGYIKSKYKNVQGIKKRGMIEWMIRLPGVTRKFYKDEKQAAIAVDKYLISKGKQPINILKPITNYGKEI